jgi:hypothetical protein
MHSYVNYDVTKCKNKVFECNFIILQVILLTFRYKTRYLIIMYSRTHFLQNIALYKTGYYTKAWSIWNINIQYSPCILVHLVNKRHHFVFSKLIVYNAKIYFVGYATGYLIPESHFNSSRQCLKWNLWYIIVSIMAS